MNTCCIHPLGTLLLDMSHFKLLEESIKHLATQAHLQQGSLFIISLNLSNLASQKINVNICHNDFLMLFLVNRFSSMSQTSFMSTKFLQFSLMGFRDSHIYLLHAADMLLWKQWVKVTKILMKLKKERAGICLLRPLNIFSKFNCN